MKLQHVLLLALCAGGSVAVAAPRETFNVHTINGGDIVCTGLDGAGNSPVVNCVATGSDGGGSYTAMQMRVTGNASAWGVDSYGSEARVRVTPPGGTPIVIQPFPTLTDFPSPPNAFDITVGVPSGTATAGTWAVDTYVTYFFTDPVGTTYDAMTLTLDDAGPTPPSATDLGNLSIVASTSSTPITLAAPNEVQWFKAILPAVTAAGPGYVDMECVPVADPPDTLDLDDADIAVYQTNGLRLVYDDGDGPGFRAAVSFGATLPNRPASVVTGATAGLAFNGRDGALTAGTHYIAVGMYPMQAPLNTFNVTSTYAGTRTKTVLRIRSQPDSAPVPPFVTAAGYFISGTNTVITAAVLPGSNPASTGLTVVANLTGLGGGASVAMNDAGVNGDAAAGDGTYSVSIVSPTPATESSVAVVITASDAQSRSSTGTANVLIGDPGDLPLTARVLTAAQLTAGVDGVHAAGTDVDMFKFVICDAAAFSVDTLASTGAPDTQLFLFDSNGGGLFMNDDINDGSFLLQSRLSAPADALTGLVAGNVYYLGVSRFDIDPMNAGAQAIWADTPYRAVRAPDGAGVTDFTVTAWDGTVTAGSTYHLTFAGACEFANNCSVADVGTTGGVAGQDRRLDNNDFVAFINLFFANAPAADVGRVGGQDGADNAWDNNDFVVFINHFFNDQANCTG